VWYIVSLIDEQVFLFITTFCHNNKNEKDVYHTIIIVLYTTRIVSQFFNSYQDEIVKKGFSKWNHDPFLWALGSLEPLSPFDPFHWPKTNKSFPKRMIVVTVPGLTILKHITLFFYWCTVLDQSFSLFNIIQDEPSPSYIICVIFFFIDSIHLQKKKNLLDVREMSLWIMMVK